MNKYVIDGNNIDAIELKCLIISRRIKVDTVVYQHHKNAARLNASPLCCNCLLLSDGTVVQLTDTNFHLRHLSSILNWDNLRLMLQGLDWVAFQCLWGCEYAATGQSCQFCFSGGDFENAAKRGKALPQALPRSDFSEMVSYVLNNDGVSNVKITGGSTFDGHAEAAHITEYLTAMPRVAGETLLYITPPADITLTDRYFELGASRIGCSIELWDMNRASVITPGKVNITGRDKHYCIKLEPTKSRGLNVCIERDIWNYANSNL